MVALRKESVDRNITNELLTALKTVALRKESVDRNIFCCHLLNIPADVALRKESVDRNMGVGTTRDRRGVSLSARRAWIEIRKNPLRIKLLTRRSPQGERG